MYIICIQVTMTLPLSKQQLEFTLICSSLSKQQLEFTLICSSLSKQQ